MRRKCEHPTQPRVEIKNEWIRKLLTSSFKQNEKNGSN